MLKQKSSSAVTKEACPGDHAGFYVCTQAGFNLGDDELQATISASLAKLSELVNGDTFQSKIKAAFPSGAAIVQSLIATNYTVTITAFCDTDGNALARAALGGDSIEYNRCMVEKDASGEPSLAQVAGVLLHEISHNVGYSHPDVNPPRTTIPYYLGDTVEVMIGGKQGSSAGQTQFGTGEGGYSHGKAAAVHPGGPRGR